MDLRQRWRARMQGESDEGFGMVELLIAMVVFSIVATAVAYGLQSALNATGQDRMRVQASSLASREMEIVRHQFTSSPTGLDDISGTALVTNPDPLSGQPVGNPLTIDGVPFTVTRTVQWMPAGAGQSACDGGSAVNYPVLAVNVKVTWSRMGSTKPVESNTILTPSKGVVSGSASFIAIKVIAASGAGQSGFPVTLTGGAATQSGWTADDGCAVFEVSPASYPTTYTASVGRDGFVDSSGSPTATRSAIITGGGNFVRPAPISYDLSATLVEKMALDPADAAAGFQLPTVLPPYSLYNSGLGTGSSATRVVNSTGAVTTIPGLWPFTSGYESWPGTCNTASVNHQAGVVVAPGATATVTHRFVPLTVTVTRNGAAQTGVAVTAAPASATGCSAAEAPLALGTTSGGGVLKTSLPTGSWTIQVTGMSPTTSGWPTLLNITRTSTAQTANVAVS